MREGTAVPHASASQVIGSVPVAPGLQVNPVVPQVLVVTSQILQVPTVGADEAVTTQTVFVAAQALVA